MNHVLNVFNIYSINLLRFGQFSFCSPSAGGTVLRKMMEFHHPLDFSLYDSPWVLFTSGRGWQKTDGTAPSSSLKTWFSCKGLQLFFGLGMNKGWSSTLNPLPLARVFWIGLAYMGWFLWAGLCASYKMEINNTCLPWVFISHGLLLVNILGFFIDTCNGPSGN